MALRLPLFAIACLLMLRPFKGAVVGWMVRIGFDGTEQGGAPARVIDAERAGAVIDAERAGAVQSGRDG